MVNLGDFLQVHTEVEQIQFLLQICNGETVGFGKFDLSLAWKYLECGIECELCLLLIKPLPLEVFNQDVP